MKGNELVWRALADRALEGQRTWRNVADLAYDARVAGLSDRAHYRVFDAVLPGDDIYGWV